MKIATFKPEFVRVVPDTLGDGIIYISMEYRTAVHGCACGCRRNVITPLGPTEWKLTYDGKVSLHPSIGNWALPCRSHYWIQGNEVRWAARFSERDIAIGRAHEQAARQRYFSNTVELPVNQTAPPSQQPGGFVGFLQRLFGR